MTFPPIVFVKLINTPNMCSISHSINNEKCIPKLKKFFVFTSIENVVDKSSVLYISGYAAFKVKSMINCDICSAKVHSSDDLGDQYFMELDRGALTVPTHEVITFAEYVIRMTVLLMSKKYESKFLLHGHQKKLLCKLVKDTIQKTDPLLYQLFNEECSCGQTYDKIFRKLLSTFSNITLNNYTKLKNNQPQIKKKKKKTNTTEGSKTGKGETDNGTHTQKRKADSASETTKIRKRKLETLQKVNKLTQKYCCQGLRLRSTILIYSSIFDCFQKSTPKT